jgi:hypothetical protein
MNKYSSFHPFLRRNFFIISFSLPSSEYASSILAEQSEAEWKCWQRELFTLHRPHCLHYAMPVIISQKCLLLFYSSKINLHFHFILYFFFPFLHLFLVAYLPLWRTPSSGENKNHSLSFQLQFPLGREDTALD